MAFSHRSSVLALPSNAQIHIGPPGEKPSARALLAGPGF
jgi:hypothetical protein